MKKKIFLPGASGQRDKARAILTIIGTVAAVLAVVLTGIVAVHQYNHRYDANAEASAKIVLTFTQVKKVGQGTITMSAGKLNYGYFQVYGPVPSEYQLFWKLSSKSNYNTPKTLTVSKNGVYIGDSNLATNKYSTKYDIAIQRMNADKDQGKLEVDFGVYP